MEVSVGQMQQQEFSLASVSELASSASTSPLPAIARFCVDCGCGSSQLQLRREDEDGYFTSLHLAASQVSVSVSLISQSILFGFCSDAEKINEGKNLSGTRRPHCALCVPWFEAVS